MATYRRMGVLFKVIIVVAIVAGIYYRVFKDHLFDLAVSKHSGPFSSAIQTLDVIVPVALSIIVLGTALWVIAGGVQEERSVMRGGPRR